MNLLNELTNATEGLKAEFLKETAKFSEVRFNKAVEIRETSNEDLEKTFIFEEDQRIILDKVCKLKNDSYLVIESGLSALVEKDLKNAKKHFENSIKKLEIRILKKGLILEGLVLDSAYIDQNLNCLISDVNGKKVKAQTIIAWGVVQKPHYRFLVK